MTKQFLSTIAPLLLSLVGACTTDVVETREASLDAEGIESLEIEVGEGDLEVHGDPEATEIEVVVELRSWGRSNGADARAVEDLEFVLDGDGATGRLRVEVGNTPVGYAADVFVTVPAGMALDINDGSGDLIVDTIDAAVTITDGSGDIELDDIGGDIDIDDGSGDIGIDDIRGDVAINDGSGDIEVSTVRGTVSVTDGSGDIRITDADDVDLLGTGSGDVTLN